MAHENQEQEIMDSDARRRAEEAVAAADSPAAAGSTNAPPSSNSNGTFTIHINVGGDPSALDEQSGTLRRRRIQENTTNQAPVHARTIDRLPQNNPHAMGQARRVQLQRAHNGQAIRVHDNRAHRVRIVTNNHGQEANQGAAARERPRIQGMHRAQNGGQAIRVAPGGRGQQVRIVANGGTGRPPRTQHVPRVPLPPLLPQPRPYHAQQYSSNDDNESSTTREERNDFKCLVCFGMFMNYACTFSSCPRLLTLVSFLNDIVLPRILAGSGFVWQVSFSILFFMHSSCCGNGKSSQVSDMSV